jgi:Na+/H+-translocating membrane pyrophosphatase
MMSLEMIIITVLAIISSLIPTFYIKLTDNTNLSNSIYIIGIALIVGTVSACLFYSLMAFGFFTTLYFAIIYIFILGAIFLTKYLINLNTK